jgi:hypothetical protein
MKKALLLALALVATARSAVGQASSPPSRDTMTAEELAELLVWRETRFPTGWTQAQLRSVGVCLAVAAKWHGKEAVVKAFKASGPRLITLIDRAGPGKPGGQLVVDFLAKYGAKGDAALRVDTTHLLALGSTAQEALVKHGIYATMLMMDFKDAPAAALVKASRDGVRKMIFIAEQLKETKRTRYAPALFRIMGEGGETAINSIFDKSEELLDDTFMETFLELMKPADRKEKTGPQ